LPTRYLIRQMQQSPMALLNEPPAQEVVTAQLVPA
jgi:hypothetical protein